MFNFYLENKYLLLGNAKELYFCLLKGHNCPSLAVSFVLKPAFFSFAPLSFVDYI